MADVYLKNYKLRELELKTKVDNTTLNAEALQTTDYNIPITTPIEDDLNTIKIRDEFLANLTSLVRDKIIARNSMGRLTVLIPDFTEFNKYFNAFREFIKHFRNLGETEIVEYWQTFYTNIQQSLKDDEYFRGTKTDSKDERFRTIKALNPKIQPLLVLLKQETKNVLNEFADVVPPELSPMFYPLIERAVRYQVLDEKESSKDVGTKFIKDHHLPVSRVNIDAVGDIITSKRIEAHLEDYVTDQKSLLWTTEKIMDDTITIAMKKLLLPVPPPAGKPPPKLEDKSYKGKVVKKKLPPLKPPQPPPLEVVGDLKEDEDDFDREFFDKIIKTAGQVDLKRIGFINAARGDDEADIIKILGKPERGVNRSKDYKDLIQRVRGMEYPLTGQAERNDVKMAGRLLEIYFGSLPK